MTRPANLPRWTTDPSAASPGAIEPNEGKKDDGYLNGEEPSAAEWNWLLKHHADWIAHLAQSRAVAGFESTHVESAGYARFRDGCYAPSAGQGQYGMFIFVGHRGADTRMYATSLTGDGWNVVTQAADVYLGVAHGGPGALGSRHAVFVGRSVTSVARVWSAPDDSASINLTVTSRTANLPSLVVSDSALRGVAWNGDVWGLCGNTGLLFTATSHDGAWVQRVPPGGAVVDYFKMLAISGRLLAFGRIDGGGGVVDISDNNGATWTRVFSSTAYGDIESPVSCGSGVLLCGTNLGTTILRSADNGLTWVPVATIPSGGTFTTERQELLWHFDGVAYAVLKRSGSETRLLVASFDRGLTWPKILRGAPGAWKWVCAASDGNRVCTGGGDEAMADGAVLYQSDEIWGG